jgi:hypothetical protein
MKEPFSKSRIKNRDVINMKLINVLIPKKTCYKMLMTAGLLFLIDILPYYLFRTNPEHSQISNISGYIWAFLGCILSLLIFYSIISLIRLTIAEKKDKKNLQGNKASVILKPPHGTCPKCGEWLRETIVTDLKTGKRKYKCDTCMVLY